MDTKLKQRLIGAIVLVALAVIFLPMLVKGPAPDSGVSDVPIEAPKAPEAGGFETRELPLVTPGTAPAGGAVGLSGPAATADAGAAATPASPAVAVAGGDYAVSFGAYASQADADIVLARLREAKLPGFVQSGQLGERKVWRVRVGPYADRAQAESARLQAVKVRDDVNAKVIALDAEPPAPAAPAESQVASKPAVAEPSRPAARTAVTESKSKSDSESSKPSRTAKAEAAQAASTKPAAAVPSTPAAERAPAAAQVGFAVQLGAFGQAAEATALRDKVRAAGFSAFIEPVPTAKGTLNRVRVGPVASRAEAERLRAELAARVGVAGMVRPHP